MAVDMWVVKFCAEECSRQKSGETSVYWMCCGVYFATLWEKDGKGPRRVIPEFIEHLGRIIEPGKNEHGFRVTPVIVPGPRQPPHHSLVEDQIRKLCDGSKTISPLEFYTAFEEIHPFVDGNGRVGSILYNYLGNTLAQPISPPDVFDPNYVKKQS